MPNPIQRAVEVGETVLGAVDKAVAQRWEPAKRAAATTSGTHAERIAELERAFTRELTAVGAAAGAAAAVPGAGTALVLGSGAAELGWVTLRAADHILRIAAAIGGSANYALARTITREADQFFRDLDS